jgi:hypothetical protein
MKSDRQSRGLESRKADKDPARVKYNMDYISSTDIPDSIRRDGFEYFWERHSIRGQNDSALDASLRRGWKPVAIDRDPQRFCDILDRNPLSRKYICQGDVILLEREIEIGEAEKEGRINLSNERVLTSPAYNFKNENVKSHSIGTVRN